MRPLCEKMTKELEISKEKMFALSQDLKVWFHELNIKCESSAKSVFLDLGYLFSYQNKSLYHCILLSRLVYVASLCEAMLLYSSYHLRLHN